MLNTMTESTMADAGQLFFNNGLTGATKSFQNLIDQEISAAKNKGNRWVAEINEMIGSRTQKWTVAGQNADLMNKQMFVWDFLLDYYFRLEMTGWERLPETPSMLVGVHSGTWLTMDAWTLCAQWWRRFRGRRTLHGTAHDVLMALPGLGSYFRAVGVIPAKRESVSAAFAAGHDVVLWPGGEVDAMRSWSKRQTVVLGNRKGFIRQAIRSGVPIVPVATYGGHNTVIVLSECRKLAKMLGLKKLLRCDIAPLILGFPFGITLEAFPMHIPLPAKIKTEILEPVEVGNDPDLENDKAYVTKKYKEVERRIQEGVNRLAGLKRRSSDKRN
jgi:1-acyl-sn-glycerol-3-phosphate acyltransferase